MPTNFNLGEDKWEVEYSYLESKGPGRWYYNFIVRSPMWLQRRVYDYIHSDLALEIVKPCTTIHARRGGDRAGQWKLLYHFGILKCLQQSGEKHSAPHG